MRLQLKIFCEVSMEPMAYIGIFEMIGIMVFLYFGKPFLIEFSCPVVLLSVCAGARAHLEKTAFRMEWCAFFARLPFSRAANNLEKHHEHLAEARPENTSKTKPKWSQKWSQNHQKSIKQHKRKTHYICLCC